MAEEPTCVQTPADVIRVEHVMELEGRSADQIVRFVTHQLRHPGNMKTTGKIHSFLSALTVKVQVVPALAVREAQVQGVAGEEGPGVQGELHAGRVRDGLAQQRHRPGSRRRPAVTPKRTNAARTMENLQPIRWDLSQVEAGTLKLNVSFAHFKDFMIRI